MTDEQEKRPRSDETSGSLGGQGGDTTAREDRTTWTNEKTAPTPNTPGSGGVPNHSAGDTTSTMGGAGSSSGGAVSRGDATDPVIGGQDTGTRPGSWGNRSGSGSGGEGERELDDPSSPPDGRISDDITGTTGTNG